MKKNNLNSKIRTYVKENISPTSCPSQKCNKCDRCFISSIYDSFKTVLNQNCIQIGSYPRFTAIRPLHDLDILYILGNWDEQNHNPKKILEELLLIIKREYTNPTNHKTETTLQSHSVSIIFKSKNNEEIFSVDIIPSYIFSKNEFKEDTYMIPEISRIKHGKYRTDYYQKILQENREIGWIESDPRGYIEIAKRVNQINNDFRKTVKFIKAWKNSCEDKYKDFKFKSFHIEQVITKYFQMNNDLEIFDSVFKFFVEIPRIIELPQIKDRVNNDKYIDEYLNELTEEQRTKILQSRDCLLIKLENFSEDDSIEELLECCFYKRFSDSEQYLFDFNIPIFTDNDFYFEIYGEAQERRGGFRKNILSKLGLININKKIKFRIKNSIPNVDLFKWKVKNDNNSEKPRGEITDHQTKNDPENTKYRGNHYVECYAINNNVCVYKARQNVKLDY